MEIDAGSRHYARGSQRSLPPTPLEKLRMRLAGLRPPPNREPGLPPLTVQRGDRPHDLRDDVTGPAHDDGVAG